MHARHLPDPEASGRFARRRSHPSKVASAFHSQSRNLATPNLPTDQELRLPQKSRAPPPSAKMPTEFFEIRRLLVVDLIHFSSNGSIWELTSSFGFRFRRPPIFPSAHPRTMRRPIPTHPINPLFSRSKHAYVRPCAPDNSKCSQWSCVSAPLP